MIHTDSPKRKLIFCTKIVRLLHHNLVLKAIGHFTVVYLVAKPLIWSEAEGDLVVIETSI